MEVRPSDSAIGSHCCGFLPGVLGEPSGELSPRIPAVLWCARSGFVEPTPIGINRSHRGDMYCQVRGEILGSWQDKLQRKPFSSGLSLIKNESAGIEDD